MPAKKPALGRGLDALFPSGAPSLATSAASMPAFSTTAIRQIRIEEIEPNPFQPRKDFDPAKLEDLAASIRSKGILQPVILRRAGENYQLVSGERRWRAAQQAGLRSVPAILREYDNQEMMEAALIENIQRDDLNAVEEAEAFHRLIEEFGLTQEGLADGVGKSRVAVTNALRLLKLPRQILDDISAGRLSAGHGRALLGLRDTASQLTIARRIKHDSLSVREVERLVKSRQRAEAAGSAQSGKALDGADLRDDVAELQEKLTGKLGLKVRINPRTNTSGKIEIHYQSLDEFRQLCTHLGVDFEQEL